ncbi:class I SAM-dependent methyltransferase [candidate division WWE3 bacterium]|jgi:SAM-dependent methyltransferase|uniref:Class I SAM-dependent methyltransferase n=1 Tax=candidate division WWE3 bacterium TaxID=2053526 RepID=A0A3A4ZC39_UNCKA|nr:MAG: class I SAM-dependent methyltransferase [candidate division WWE3 bacterium]
MSILEKHKKAWDSNEVLRYVYCKWYKQIVADLSQKGTEQEKTVEIGSGIGSFKEFYPKCISTDIGDNPNAEMRFDAHEMPFENESVDNLVLIDVLHHLQNPLKFLGEGARVLKKGGRLIMLEPYPSIMSRLIFGMFHREPFDFRINIYNVNQNSDKDPWEGNQAIPYLIFCKNGSKFEDDFGGAYIIRKKDFVTTLVYPVSGGFSFGPLLSGNLVSTVEKFNRITAKFPGLFAFRIYIVLEKK